MPDDPFQSYLGYLDKEMSIMGLLSSFSVAAVALLLGTLKPFDTGSLGRVLWDRCAYPLGTAIVMLLLAAYLFYRQRSHLAWHYGNITYWIAAGMPDGAMESLRELQDHVEEWRYYLHGLNAVVGGVIGVVATVWYAWVQPPGVQPWWLTAAIVAGVGVASLWEQYVISRDRAQLQRSKRRRR